MAVSVSDRRVNAVVLTVVIAGAYLLLSAWAWAYTMDDAFIAFRYAKHIGDGIGPIWNLADKTRPVEGFTSFLYVWMLGSIRFITGADPELLGKVLGVLACLALAGFVTREIQREKLRGVAAVIGLSFLLLPFTALNSVSGMATSLFMLWNWLCALTCVRVLDRPTTRMTWRFVLFGLLGTLTRPEFALSFIVMAAYVYWQRPSLRPTLLNAMVVLYVLPGLVVTGWRYSYYGDVFPNPFYVKQTNGLNKWGALYVIRFLGFLAMPYIILAATGWRTLWNSHRNLLAVVVLSVGVPCVYFSTTVPTMGWWYRFLLPQIPLLAFCAGVAIEGQETRVRGPRLFWRYVGSTLIVLISLAHVPMIARFLTFHEANEVRYREVGRRLRPFAAADRWLVYHDVGSLVYESEWNAVDVVGLNSHREKIQSPCLMKTDIVLRSSQFREDIRNPCPELYVPVADLPFLKQDPIVDRYMRVFARNDISYAVELRENLLEKWPAQFTRRNDWLAWYWEKSKSLFFQS